MQIFNPLEPGRCFPKSRPRGRGKSPAWSPPCKNPWHCLSISLSLELNNPQCIFLCPGFVFKKEHRQDRVGTVVTLVQVAAPKIIVPIPGCRNERLLPEPGLRKAGAIGYPCSALGRIGSASRLYSGHKLMEELLAIIERWWEELRRESPFFTS